MQITDNWDRIDNELRILDNALKKTHMMGAAGMLYSQIEISTMLRLCRMVILTLAHSYLHVTPGTGCWKPTGKPWKRNTQIVLRWLTSSRGGSRKQIMNRYSKAGRKCSVRKYAYKTLITLDQLKRSIVLNYGHKILKQGGRASGKQ